MNMKTNLSKRILGCGRDLGLLATVVLLAGLAASTCCSAAEQEKAGTPAPTALRVGIAPEYPPLVFRQPEGTNGVEIDLAKALGAELNRPVKFVVVNFDDLVPALVENRIDIIMSGMSVTKAREFRIAFSDPYVKNQLRAIFRLKDVAQYGTAADVLKTTARVGVVPGTTGDIFVSKNCTKAQRLLFPNRKDVPILLVKTGRMDLFVDDTFALAPMVAENEAEIAYLQEPLNEEDIAWGVRQSDKELLRDVNQALAKWKTDGTLEKVLDRWIPYLKTFNAKQAKTPKA